MSQHPFGFVLDPASSLTHHTGAWRTRRPLYVERTSPCDDACPAGEAPRTWIDLVRNGKHRAAWDEIVRVNPMPAITGRACYHPCESACHRAEIDGAVSIHALERYLGDMAMDRGWSLPAPAPPTGKRVLVVGGGPAGLSAAYQLARRGHRVTLREATSALGGMLRHGIPKYRLPRDVIDAEIDRIVGLGLDVVLGARVDDIAAAQRDFDACFTALGAGVAHRVDIPNDDARPLVDALSFLAGDGAARIGRRVVVYGGGNTAIDAARTARRQGADDTVIIYRRTQKEMPAHEQELREALEEGIRVRWLRTIQGVTGEHLTLERMELDEHGKPRPTGQLETLDADTVLLAVGQDADLGPVRAAEGVVSENGIVRVDPRMQTGHRGLFAGGDMTSEKRTIAHAIGQGGRAAIAIDDFLAARSTRAVARLPIAPLSVSAASYVDARPPAPEPTLDGERRRHSFDEVHTTLDDRTAAVESTRCLSCGHCFGCDNCFAVCPDDAIEKLGDARYSIDLDFCKGCGLCVAECPTGAMVMQEEQLSNGDGHIQKVASIDASTLYELVAKRARFVLVDVRQPDEVEKDPVRLPGLLCIPSHQLFLRREELPLGTKHLLVVTLSNTGERARAAALALRLLGLAHARHLEGGLSAWKKLRPPGG